MSRSAKEKQYDNKTANYVVGKIPADKPGSLITGTEQVYKEEDLKLITGRGEKPDSSLLTKLPRSSRKRK